MITFSIVLAWVLIFPVNHNLAIFSLLSDTENLNKPAQGRLQAEVIPRCSTYLTITLILISEQPTNMS